MSRPSLARISSTLLLALFFTLGLSACDDPQVGSIKLEAGPDAKPGDPKAEGRFRENAPAPKTGGKTADEGVNSR